MQPVLRARPHKRVAVARQRGFTMTELVVVLIVAGILAAYALPKMTSALSQRDNAWHEALQSALRFAQKSAVSRRRLTCVTLTSTAVTISTATSYGATTCPTSLPGPDGTATFASTTSSSATVSNSPMYFQPDGRVTTDAAGTTTANMTVSVSGAQVITVYGETGYVE